MTPSAPMRLDEVDLVLASTSHYRKDLLQRLALKFRVCAPDVDESARLDESPSDLAQRLAAAKAEDVARRNPGALIVGSDQVAEMDGTAIGKPGSVEAACTQLAASSGRCVTFHTALCIVDTRGPAHINRSGCDVTRVHFRELDRGEIGRYVAIEKPLDCAGSFKVEGLGITLFERVETLDPSALIGLPLIRLAAMLRASGIALP